MDDLKEFMKDLKGMLENLMWYRDEIIALLVIATLLFCLVAGSAYGFGRFECRQTAIIVGTDYRFSIVAGCYLRDQNNQWVEKKSFFVAQAIKNNSGKQF